MNWTAIIWLGMLLLFLLTEAATVSLVSLWFALGALAAIVISLTGGPLWLQALVFVAVSGVTLALLRPLVRKYFKPKLVATNSDALLGTTGQVTQAIDNIAAQGRVKLGGMEWSARSSNGDPIPADALIRVDRIEGAKVLVTIVSLPVSN